jgi:hypothetical protein
MRSRIQRWATRIVLLVPLAGLLYSPSAALAGAVASAKGFLPLDALTVADADPTVITGDLGLAPGSTAAASTPALSRIDSSARLTGTFTFSGTGSAHDAISVVQIGAAVSPADGSAIKRFSGENSRMSWQIGTAAAGDPGTDPALAGEVPEPGTVSLFCLGLLTLTLYAWRSRKRLV